MRDLPTGTVSLMFTDIESSTELLHHVGDQTYGELLLTHQRILRQAFADNVGIEMDTQGDAFFVVFPRAWNAVGAAIEAQNALATYPWPDGNTIRVRMGIHTGEPTLVENTRYVGLDLHRGARIVSAGYGGQVLLSERTFAMMQGLMPRDVTAKDMGEHRLKGLAHPEHIFQLVIPGLPSEFPPLKSLEVPTNNLPQQLTTFVGRARDIAAIKELLSTTCLLTLVGPGGAGKTRLSLQVAGELTDQFPQGVWLVELAPLTDPERVSQAIATVLGVREQPGRALMDSLVDYLRSKNLLLVLDNCEHLIVAAAQAVQALVRACPSVKIIASSREPLGVVGERMYRVQPLARPEPRRVASLDQLREFEAVQLFVDRAVASNPAFGLTEGNAPAVLQVVNRLDGIPLALELAAARVRSLSVEQIATRLDDRFKLLTGGSRTGLPHHQTLRATMDWGYELLSEPERQMLRRISVFAGGFSLEAAEQVCPGQGIDEFEVLDPLAHLVDKSLVVAEGLNGDTRYRLLETVRQYGREKLVDAGEVQRIRSQHLQWCLTLATDTEPKLFGPEQMPALDRLELEHDNLRAALEWGRSTPEASETGLRLAGTLSRFWYLRGYLTEGREWLETLLGMSTDAAAPVRAKALYAAAALASHQGDDSRAAELCKKSLSLYRSTEDRFGMALVLNTQGHILRRRGQYQEARLLLEESLAASASQSNQWAHAEALNTLGSMARQQDDYDRAKVLLEESLKLWRGIGDKSGLAAALVYLGGVARNLADYDRARILMEESLALRRELRDQSNLASSLISLGLVAMDQGDNDRAIQLFQESLGLCRELGNKVGVAASLANLAIVARFQGDYDRARSLLEESTAICRDLDNKRALASSLRLLGTVVKAQGDGAQALKLYAESLELSRALSDRLGTAECLEFVAPLAAETGQSDLAARLLGAAEALREGIKNPLRPSDLADYKQSVSVVQARLDEVTFRQAWTEGRAMSLEEAITLAERVAAPASSEAPPGAG